MAQRNNTLPALLALALAACQQPADDSNIAIDNGVNAAEAAAADVETLPPSETSVPPTSSNAGAAPLNEADDGGSEDPKQAFFPAQYRGRWGLVPADCTSTRGDAKGLITITADAIRFYESVARPAALTSVGERRLDGNYAATGEGQSWTLLQRLELDADGKTLTRTVDEGDSAPSSGGNRFVYTRCPA